MILSVSLAQKVFSYFLTLAAWFGLNVQNQNVVVQQNVQMVVTLTCPPTTKIDCPENEPALFTNLAEFIANGGSVTANCGIDTISFGIMSTNSVDVPCNKTTSTVYQIIDSCGGSSSCMHIIEVRDETTPVINCPGTTVPCPADIPPPFLNYTTWYTALIAEGGSISDNCSIDTSSFTYLGRDTVRAGKCISAIRDRYSVKDSCENEAICNKRFSVVNNIFPTFTAARDTTLFTNGQCFADTSTGSTGTILNPFHPCGVDTISRRDIAKPGCTGSIDTIYRIWRVTDICGKATIDTQHIYLKDTTKPNISGPGDQKFLCGELVPPPNINLITATDNCTSVPVIRFVKDSTSDSTCQNQKIIRRIYEATDQCNNTQRFIQIIEVKDTVPPGLICPANSTLLCASGLPAPNTLNTIPSDNCLGAVIVIHVKDSIADSTCTNKKNVFRIYKATDLCDNMGFCTQRLRINDSIPPTITCPANQNVTCGSNVSPVNINLVIAADLCSTPIVIHAKDSVTDSTCVNKKVVRRIYQASDACGNLNRCIQLITVNDNISPSITCPRDTTVECVNFTPIPNTSAVLTSDNCTGALPIINFVKDSIGDSVCVNQKNVFRTYSASDACMNTASCIQKISINDVFAPVLTGMTNTDTLMCGQTFTIITPIANEACGLIPVNSALDTLPGTCPGNYIILIHFTAIDACGNQALRTDTVTYLDNNAPMITCPADVEIECVDNPYSSLDTFILDGGSVSDDCGLDSNSFKFVSESITESNGFLTIIRKYAISDLCGNADTCMQMLRSPICITDLALKAVINGGDPFLIKAGGSVPVSGIIYNQGFVPVDSIKVIQYLTPGVKIASPDWIFTSDTTKACFYLSVANGLLPAGGLLPGDTIKFNFVLTVGKSFGSSKVISTLEISQVKDLEGNILTDIDSTPDEIPTNDPGGIPLTPDDNKIDGDSRLGEDEDDHDPILFYVYHPLVCVASANATTAADLNCSSCITAKDVLKGILLPDEFYSVKLFDSFGRELQDSCIPRQYLNQVLTYKVSIPLVEKDNSCWGYIIMEDKTPPQIDCSNDTIFCVDLNGLPPLPEVQDNCSGTTQVVVVHERWEDYGCDSGEIKGVYIRSIKAADTWGNINQCDKRYYIHKIILDSIDCPRDTSIDCNLEVVKGVRFSHPDRSGTPSIDGVKLWPNNPSCNNFVYYTDDSTKICGYGYKIIRNWIIVDHCTGEQRICKQHIKVEDKSAPVIDTLDRYIKLTADPHVCNAVLKLDTLSITDCSKTVQRYVFTYFSPDEINKVEVQKGTLPATLSIPIGKNHKIYIDITDACGNRTVDSIMVTVTDVTPPTPVCDEFTQITLDPTHCWAQIAAADLDNGSHDNCCEELHFAAAFMSDIDSAKAQFERKIVSECGSKEYWDNKKWYDEYINEWINCFVFKDTLDAQECGSSRVVLRVYEACEVPGYDAHEFPCSPHAWYCYNTSWLYRVLFNYNFKSAGATKECSFKAPWGCKSAVETKLNEYNQYNVTYYRGGNPISKSCFPLFAQGTSSLANGNCRRQPLFSDCMIEVIADDKVSPICEGLKDIIIYCDSVPYSEANEAWNICPGQGEEYPGTTGWPLEIKRTGYSSVFGYYGGSRTTPHDDHNTSEATCLPNQRQAWSPIYCRSWLELDRYDSDKTFDPSLMFFTPVKVDKKNTKRGLARNEFYVIDNCLIDSILSKDQRVVDKCGTGWIQRTWRIKDKCGNVSECSQKIIIKHRSDFEVLFPEDKEIKCEASQSLTTDITGKPILSDDECEQVGSSFQDDTFYTVEDACYKIVRKWTLIDACQYDPNQHGHQPDVIINDTFRANKTDRFCEFRNIKDNGDGYITYTQIIKIIDTVPPVLTCKDTTLCISGNDCFKEITLPIKVADNCSNDIWFTISIDNNGDGQYESMQSHVRDLKSSLPAGTYNIKVEAIDHCKNIATCMFTLTVKDCKAPTPYCLNGVATVIMPTSGSLEVWASDLNKGSFDNCTAADKLKFTFDDKATLPSRIFTCKDITNGRLQLIDVNIWVHDEAGNKDFCKTYIQLEDNPSAQNPEGVCPDLVASLVSISGTAENESSEPIEKVTVKTTANGSGLPYYTTSTSGKFAFSNIPYKGTVTVEPERKDDPMNGISTLDLVLIQKYLLGQGGLTTPYKMIAADVNQSGSIDVADLLELRKLILGLYEKLPASDSWRFIPKSYKFNDPTAPWSYPMKAVVEAIDKDQNIEFTGVKIGDVNNSSSPHSLLGTEIRESAGGLVLKTENKKVNKGDKVRIEWRSDNFDQFLGMQGTFIHPGMKLLDVESDKLDLQRANIGVKPKESSFTFSWHHDQPMSLKKSDVLFTLTFIAETDLILSESLLIGSQTTRAESYRDLTKAYPLSIGFVDSKGKAKNTSELYQNYPNPFKSATVISMQLAQAGYGTLTIYDIQGRVVKNVSKNWEKGYNEIRIDKALLSSPGIWYYKFDSKFFNSTRKMVLID